MSVRFYFVGLEELKTALRNLPAELTSEGGHIVEGRANGAAATIKGGYPSRSGELRDKLTVEHTRSRFGARSIVRNSSKYADEFEHGSEARHYVTKNGVKHLTGKMPPNPLFTQTVIRARRAMYDDLRGLLTRAGLQVSGEP